MNYCIDCGKEICRKAKHCHSCANRKRKFSEETKIKMSKAHKGIIFSEEHRKKLSEAGKKRCVSEETKKKISMAHKGKHLSEETKRKLSAMMRGRIGENALNWKGGRRLSYAGYVLIYSPNHPHSGGGKCVCEHRLIMEKYIGRYLYPWETVHHINGIKDDNRIKNLKLLPGNEHNTKIQEIYKENLFLKKQLTRFLEIKV
jgi:hypothetical protein